MNPPLLEVECNSREETKRIPYPPHISSSKRIAIMGSCDGLLCLLGSPDHKIAVFNPSTGKYFGMQIAKSQDRLISCYWFGRVAGKYLLVLGFGLPYKMEVYNFSRGSELQLIQSLYFDLHLPRPTIFTSFTDRGLFFRGAVHWPARLIDAVVRNDDIWGVILAFHLEQNNWFKISLPPLFWRCGFILGVADECLFVIFKPDVGDAGFELWIKKEYGVEQSWTKWANIEGLHQYRFLYPLGFLTNGDLILDADRRHLIQYNFNDFKLLQRDDCSRRREAIICADSLLSPTTLLAS